MSKVGKSALTPHPLILLPFTTMDISYVYLFLLIAEEMVPRRFGCPPGLGTAHRHDTNPASCDGSTEFVKIPGSLKVTYEVLRLGSYKGTPQPRGRNDVGK